ncbi:MAG: hypothetical protein H0S82_06430 [Anaerolineaceae bacterium]|nr:hypothetical protein [Anaerolineaceae bacterium]
MKHKPFWIGIIVILILGGIGLGIALMLTSPTVPQEVTESSPTEVTVMAIDPNEEQARQVLTEFLSALNSGDYASAEKLYGGAYDVLTGYNPDLDPADHAALLERGCTTNGLNCLLLMNATLDQVIDNNEFVFTVELQNQDGSRFEIGPCCGEDETNFTPTTEFTFTVIRTIKGQYQVMDLPPYTP